MENHGYRQAARGRSTGCLKTPESCRESNTDALQRAMKDGGISAIAWLTRNLLELMVWSEYCAQCEANAKTFALDSARDANDMLNIPDGLFAPDFSFRAAKRGADSKEQGGRI